MKTIIAITYFNIGVDVLGFVKHWVHEYYVLVKDKRKTSGNMYNPKKNIEYEFYVNQFSS